jgi:hypothetical protein
LYHPIVELRKRQRNDLFAAVVDSGLNATEFDLSVKNVPPSATVGALLTREQQADDDNWLAIIDHPASESRFKVYPLSPTSPSRLPRFFVWSKVGADPFEREYPLEWSGVPVSAAEWATGVKDYVDTPDLWNEMRAQRELLAETTLESLENTPFTPAEQAAISAQLREIKNYISENYELTSEQFARAEARIDEAEAASHRLHRKDWLLLFLGTTVTLYVADVVPATAVQHITALVLQGLGHLFGIAGSPPPIAG